MSDQANNSAQTEKLGFSGALANKFLLSEITPLLALVGILLGLFAVIVTPKEEEPQINVTFANVFIPFPGASVSEVEHLVSAPAEQVISEISGIDHVYSISRHGMSILTVQFEVGENRTDAIVRLYSKIFSNLDWLPANLGVGQPIIKPKGIDDVPIVTATLWSDDDSGGAYELLKVAHAIESELKRIPGTRDIYTIGGAQHVVRVELNPQKIAGFNLDINAIRRALTLANQSQSAGSLVGENREIPVQAGVFMTNSEEVGSLVVGMHQGRPVYLNDIATIIDGPADPELYVWYGTGPAAAQTNITPLEDIKPAVTIAVAKKPSTNAVEIAERVIKRFDQLQGTFIPEGVNFTITRNYGETADTKANTLILKLIFATGVVILLVAFALGLREAFIVGTAIAITLLITLFASWAWGFTLNRVSLFALIFSIGILVDDAIVVVENIHRHMSMGKKSLLESIPAAVDEVGGPTILATFTVIAALLPMAFVTGLMGPYMSPIPINASMGMVISLLIAFIVTPWLSYKVFAGHEHKHANAGHADSDQQNWIHQLFTRLMSPFVRGDKQGRNFMLLNLGVLVLIILSVSLVTMNRVVLKMLPFDNKSEFQIIVDMPEGTALETTAMVVNKLGDYIATVPEVSNYQAYVGTAAPINFNGLVRQYYLREGGHLGDIQVNLIDKSLRDRNSHEIARSVRDDLQRIGSAFEANVKLAEVPPGPPVMSSLVAEVYGLDYQGQIEVAKRIRPTFAETADIVDIDDSIEAPADRFIVHIDRQKAASFGISQASLVTTLKTALQGEDISFIHGNNVKFATPIRLRLPKANKEELYETLAIKLRNPEGKMVALSELVRIEQSTLEKVVYHKDLLPVVFVTADMAGDLDSPLYGMFEIVDQLEQSDPDLQQYYINQPDNPYQYSIKWDGEWQITYETFRDMGIAYSIGLLLIYLLVVAQFRSYIVPLVIMAPIPLTVIGVMPGHDLLDAKFTATSMIGMIALAGIIVRNSILLVDFMNELIAEGMDFADAVITSAAVRAKPIVLTGLAAMLGAFFILDDPIFKGLAISLIFGIFVSTLLTLVIIPVLYYQIKKGEFAAAAND
ncbi:MAG: efflux RND transporter permease subunit [Gammaproteobacteria bacterium]|nr:efflux RND transporter permease subunit [Gammaproteobacteria bacterium]